MAHQTLHKEQCILVLQGGALNAYQAGGLEALSRTQCAPYWAADISISAINYGGSQKRGFCIRITQQNMG
jgi:hypothetical protein